MYKVNKQKRKTAIKNAFPIADFLKEYELIFVYVVPIASYQNDDDPGK